MLHDPARHEALRAPPWDDARARDAIERIVRDTESRFSPETYWPMHPLDVDPSDDPAAIPTPLYFGATGVMWALRYLQAVGAAALARDPIPDEALLLARNRDWLAKSGPRASYLMGDTPIQLMRYGRRATAEGADELAALIEGHVDDPTLELMWGSPGTLLAALFLHERTGDPRWAALFRQTAAMLWSRLEWSEVHGCHIWTQALYGRRSRYLDAVHGFVATASPLIRGRHLLTPEAWDGWAVCIANTVGRTATVDNGLASWRPQLDDADLGKRLMQFCHGAPGFVICLAEMPGTALDALLLAAGEAVWAAGPLAKGSNLCHGTGGNGYAFLKLYRRTHDERWLARARAFAMHGIAQTDAAAAAHGQMRYSLWTGDPGFAIYLWDCVQAQARFPTLDVFFGDAPAR